MEARHTKHFFDFSHENISEGIASETSSLDVTWFLVYRVVLASSTEELKDSN